MTRLAGKIALVTGGRGGIGRAIVKRFLAEGAHVYAADLTEQGSLAEHDADGSHFIKLDVTSEADAIAAMERVRADHGRLDILVNAAGIEIEKTIEDTTLEEWNTSFAVNVTGTFLTSKYALPLMRAAAAGGTSSSIINFGSYDGFIADPGLAAYCATKGAVHALPAPWPAIMDQRAFASTRFVQDMWTRPCCKAFSQAKDQGVMGNPLMICNRRSRMCIPCAPMAHLMTLQIW